jgi:hypothetical protein
MTLIAILLAFFAIAIGLVRLAERLLREGRVTGDLAAEPPDARRLSLAQVSREAWSAVLTTSARRAIGYRSSAVRRRVRRAQ